MPEKRSSQKEVEFTPPEGFKPPEGTDKEWDMVCSFRSNPDGTICMTKLGDTPMPGYDDDHDEANEHKPDYGEYSQSIMDAGNAAGGSGGQSSSY